MNPYWEAGWRLLFPSECGFCRALLDIGESGLCRTCLTSLRAMRFPFEEAMIGRRFEFLDDAWAVYPYLSPVKELIAAVKFEAKSWLIKVFQEDFGETAQGLCSGNAYDCFLPVPLGRDHFAGRGFNQSELLADLGRKKTGIQVERRALRKKIGVPAQSGLHREERQCNLLGAFVVGRPGLIAGKNILLVDDIFTTGATAEEVSRVLKNAGAQRVDLIALAKAKPVSEETKGYR